jgi:hypothetical protein
MNRMATGYCAAQYFKMPYEVIVKMSAPRNLLK